MKMWVGAALGAAMMVAGPAQGAVVTFDELATSDFYAAPASPLTSGGLVFTAAGNFSVYGSGTPYTTDPGGAALAYQGGAFDFTREGGGLFDLQSIDVGNPFNGNGGNFGADDSAGSSVRLDFFDASGSVGSRTLAVAGGSGQTHFDLNLTGLSRVQFDSTGGLPGNQLDNVTYSTVAAAPEPAAWGMMIVGFGVAGGALRRTRRLRAIGVKATIA